ncbi:hypothetical protein DPMN_005291 [Dreissena polymorpha]|uniref:Uncharacterized protein n=1 Tax=Dreissena polymorpha TaxID=45954 RepID=A0A9D4MT78_DREPO|nr:hypothetical protein DPMN_005291 [Dreissena polymorpha]
MEIRSSKDCGPMLLMSNTTCSNTTQMLGRTNFCYCIDCCNEGVRLKMTNGVIESTLRPYAIEAAAIMGGKRPQQIDS